MNAIPLPRPQGASRPKDSRTSVPVLNRQTLLLARSAAKTSGRSVLAELEALTKASPRGLLRVLAKEFGLTVLEPAELQALPPALDRLPLSRAMQRQCLLLQPEGGTVAIGVLPDPFDTDLLTWLESQVNGPMEVRLALQSDIQAYLGKLEETVRATVSMEGDDDGSGRDGRTAAVLSFASVSEAASPAVKIVNSTLYDSLKARASDIHLESTANGLAVKYRIDGVLDHAASMNGVELAEQVISRLKVLAELDISERRVPQDGSFRVEAGGREIDLRVSIMPSIHGEDAVIRILDKRAMMSFGTLSLDTLGYDADTLRTLRELAEEPHGMLLVTGPTGSGKTTTLYAALSEVNNGQDKIITIEDPVEYQLQGILQIPVNERKGLTFAKGLRSILRHDPDKIMVGEIRDKETAEIAVQSALTGHLVLTTVHANNVFDVFGRFTHMGVDAYAFCSALNGIWAQRLMRLSCVHCATPFLPSDADIARLGLTRRDTTGWNFRRGAGCGECRNTGYKGRKAIAEILVLTDEIREMVIEKRPIRQIKELAWSQGTKSLRDAALALVRAGETTIDEVRRVTQHG